MIGSTRKPPASIGMPLLKTGQVISYASGDDGDLQEGRDQDFFLLPGLNPFGNSDRFTDLVGDQVYLDDIVIDWSTFSNGKVLGYYRLDPLDSVYPWEQALELVQIGGFSVFGNWRMINIKELVNLWNFEASDLLNYAPFTFSYNQRVGTWLSTTNPVATSEVFFSRNGNSGEFLTPLERNLGQTTTIAVRNFSLVNNQLI